MFKDDKAIRILSLLAHGVYTFSPEDLSIHKAINKHLKCTILS